MKRIDFDEEASEKRRIAIFRAEQSIFCFASAGITVRGRSQFASKRL